MAASAISSVLQVLNHLILKEVGLLWGVDNEMKKLSSTLSTIQAVLDDAELKQYQQSDIKNWLHKLKDAVYEVWNILDDCETEAFHHGYGGQTPGALRKVWSCYPLKKSFFRHNIRNRMTYIAKELNSISQERIKFHLNDSIPENRTQTEERCETSSGVTELEIFGRETDKDHIEKDDCWMLFRQRAFGLNNEESPELVAIGKDIVKKCGGVPSAAKALGGLMRSKKGVKEWLNIKESDMWDLPQGEVPILPALRLSYYNLPLELRHCFSYCAIFPKGSRMKKDKLIQLWMANGFISSRGRLGVEDVGNEVWNELYKRSLFLKDEDEPEDMFMHDLVHDLALSIMGDEICTMEAESSSTIPNQKIRHATLVSNGKNTSAFPEALKDRNKLHSILLQDRDQYIEPDSECEFSCDFKNFGSLRVFDANGAKMMRLSGSIGNSKHLTYLNLSGTSITKLPESICGLPHLQTLNLDECEKLERLPKKICRLTSLRHLYLRECYKIEDTPPKLGKLTQLKTLSLFVVGERDGQSLGELGHLDLGGELKLKHLERLRNSMVAKEANLVGKDNLRVLEMTWEYSEILQGNMVDEEVIEALEPHPNIRELEIWGYRGKEMPVWMSDPSVLRNVVEISMNDCTNCLGLPALWNLPCLKRLHVSGIMEKTEYMFQNVNNNSNEGSIVTSTAKAFWFLEELWISDMENLIALSMEVVEEGGGTGQHQQLFPCLRNMWITSCPLLVLPNLPTLKYLVIYHSSSFILLDSISKLTSLTSLRLYGNEDMVSLPEELLQNLSLLQNLDIENFSALNVLPENMSSLSSLMSMSIWYCPKIVSLPDSIQTLTQLQNLTLQKCSTELERRCELGKGEDWYKIAHIPQLWISDFSRVT